MVNKKIILFAVFFISLVAISTVSAVDNATDDLASVESGSQVNEVQTATEDGLKTSLDDGQAIQETDLSEDDKLSQAEGMDVLGDELVNTTFLYPEDNYTYTVPDILNSNVTFEFKLCDLNKNLLNNKTVTVEFGGVSKNITSKLGVCKYQILKTEPGTYNLTMKFAGDETYNATEGKVTVVISLAETQIIAANNSVYQRPLILQGFGYYNMTLATNEVRPVSISNKTVRVKFNGTEENRVTDENGTISYLLQNYPAGEYTFEIAFDGGEGYAPSNRTTSVKFIDVETQIIAVNNSVYKLKSVLENSTIYNISLAAIDSNSGSLFNKTVYVTFNGKTENFTTDELGMVRYAISNVSAGNHTIEIAFKGVDGYLACNATNNIEIVDVKTKLYALNDTAYPRSLVLDNLGIYPILLANVDGIIPIPLANRTVYITFNRGDRENFTTDAVGLINYILPNVTADNYTIEIEFEGADEYAPCNVTKTVEIVDVETKISALGNVTYSRPLVIGGLGYYPIFLTNNGTVPIPLGNKTVYVTFGDGDRENFTTNIAGLVNYVLPNVTADNYTIKIEFEGADGYIASSVTKTVEIVDLETKISALGNATYSRPRIVEGLGYYPIFLTSAGTLPLPLGNKTVYVTFGDGDRENFTTNIAGLINYVLPWVDAGNYTIKIEFEGVDGYVASSVTKNVEIVDVKTKLISPDNAEYKHPTVLDGKAIYRIIMTTDTTIPIPLENKRVFVTFNGIRQMCITNALGMINFVIPDVPAGNYTIEMEFKGSNGYTAVNATGNVEISDVKTKITAANNTEYKHSKVLDGDATYLILLTSDDTIPLPLANKTVYVAFDGKGDNYTTNALGLINYVIPVNATSGVHTIDIVFEEAGGYLTSSATRNVEIVDVETKITSINNMSYSYSTVMKGNAIYPILLTTTGLIPSLLANKTVYIEFDGKGANFTTNAIGLINYMVNASAGEHTLNIMFAGEGGYVPCNKTTKITISKVPSTLAINVSEISFDYNGIGTCKVSYTGASNITAKIMDNPNAVVTVKDNIISVSALDVGTYTLFVATIPDENHTETSLTAKVTVNKTKTQLVANGITTTYQTNKNLVITLKDNQGNLICGAKVTVNLNGEKTFTTDNKGQIKVATKGLAPKTYTATITYNGDKNLLQVTKSVKVVVKKAKSKITAKKKTFKKSKKVKKYTITLKANKKPIKKVKVTLKVKGKTYKAKTNKKGKATFKIKKLTKKGKHKATIKFAGNKNYKAATKKVKIVVK